MSDNEQSVSILSLAGVSKTYRGFPALDHVSLEMPAGLLMAVTGKSGSGKSTLLNLIAGIDRPTSGQVVVGGVDTGQLDESALAAWRGNNVGIVFQFFQLLPTLTIAENVMLPMDFAGVLPVKQQHAKALSLLDQVGIADQAGKLPSALSGGQQQRAAIARALANDPALVVADEPTGNLDSATADVVIGLLRGLTKRGTSVVIVTHDGDLARKADRSVALADGRIVHERAREVAHA